MKKRNIADSPHGEHLMMDVDIVVSLVWCGSFFVSTSCSKLSCRLCSIMLALPTVRHFLQAERGGEGAKKEGSSGECFT